MVEKMVQARLDDGTLVEHKTSGYRGRIDGITEIKSCFTRAGAVVPLSMAKEAFQYRVVVTGEMMRHIAPAEDLQIVAEEASVKVSCFNCHEIFRTKPHAANKVGGRCTCGGWICPECFACDASIPETRIQQSGCKKQTQRMKRRQTKNKQHGRSS